MIQGLYKMNLNVRFLKLEIYIPETNLGELQGVLQKEDAGHIGNYDSCMAVSRVTGMWRPLQGSNPFIGSENEVSEGPELKVEVRIRAEALESTIDSIKRIHPYEEPLINVIPLLSED